MAFSNLFYSRNSVEYERGRKHVFVTSGVKDLLHIPEWKSRELYQNAPLFSRYISGITAHPVNFHLIKSGSRHQLF